MIRGYLARGSFARRIVTRAVVVLGAVLVGGQVMRNLPRDQVLIFPVGSVFPNASHFDASWRQLGDDEPRGGVSRNFGSNGPPLQIREHAKLPDGDYIVTIDIGIDVGQSADAANVARTPNAKSSESAGAGAGLQTNIERRVSLGGGETMIVLAVDR